MLPKLEYPIHTLTLPCSNKTVNYRPFLVKEEKLLLMAAQSKDPIEIKDIIIQVINNCILDESDVQELPTPDVEWLLINLRAKSVGGKIKNEYVCNNTVQKDDESVPCGQPFTIEIDLDSIDIKKPDVDDKIKLNNKVGLKMRMPRFSVIQDVNDDVLFNEKLLRESIEYIYDADGIYKLSDIGEEELQEFLNSMSKEQYDMVNKFLLSVPTFSYKTEHKCTKCGFVHKINIDNFTDFF